MQSTYNTSDNMSGNTSCNAGAYDGPAAGATASSNSNGSDRATMHATIHTTPDDWSDAPRQTTSKDGSVGDGSARGGFTQTVEQMKSKAAKGFGSDWFKNIGSRVLMFVVGVVLVLIGIPMLVLPGPGLLSIAAGIGCICGAFTHKTDSRTAR